MEGIAKKVWKVAHNIHEVQQIVEERNYEKIFEKMQELNIIDVRTDTLCIDSTSIKVHPDAAGARKSSGEQSIGRSKGG